MINILGIDQAPNYTGYGLIRVNSEDIFGSLQVLATATRHRELDGRSSSKFKTTLNEREAQRAAVEDAQMAERVWRPYAPSKGMPIVVMEQAYISQRQTKYDVYQSDHRAVLRFLLKQLYDLTPPEVASTTHKSIMWNQVGVKLMGLPKETLGEYRTKRGTPNTAPQHMDKQLCCRIIHWLKTKEIQKVFPKAFEHEADAVAVAAAYAYNEYGRGGGLSAGRPV